MSGEPKWREIPLPQVVFFQEGPGVRKWQFAEAGVKLLNVGNINNGKLTLGTTKLYVSEEEAYGRYSHFLVDEGDLLIASSGIIVDNFHNKIAYARKEDLPLCLNTSTIRFKSRDKKILDIDYFKYFLMTEGFKAQLRRYITGSAQLNFGPSHLKQMTLPLPSLSEQKRIAVILDAADGIRAKRKAAIAKLDELAQSVFLEMFGDPVRNPRQFPEKPLRDLVRDDDTINYGVVQPGNDVENGKPLIRVGDIQNGKVRHTELKLISAPIEQNYKRSRLRGDEILISCVGTTGSIALADESVKGFNIARAVARVPLSPMVNRIYVAEYLKTKRMQRYFYSELRAVSQPTLNIKQIAEAMIICPPMKQQEVFAGRVLLIESMRSSYNLALEKEEALFASLQHRAFAGEL